MFSFGSSMLPNKISSKQLTYHRTTFAMSFYFGDINPSGSFHRPSPESSSRPPSQRPTTRTRGVRFESSSSTPSNDMGFGTATSSSSSPEPFYPSTPDYHTSHRIRAPSAYPSRPPPSYTSRRLKTPPLRSALRSSPLRSTVKSPRLKSALKQTTRRNTTPTSSPPPSRSHFYNDSPPPPSYHRSLSPPPKPKKTYPPNWLCTADFRAAQIRTGTARCVTELNFDFWDTYRPGVSSSDEEGWAEVFEKYEYYCEWKKNKGIFFVQIREAKIILHRVIMQFSGGDQRRAEKMADALLGDGEFSSFVCFLSVVGI